MAKEILAVPEDDLKFVCEVIRAGLKAVNVPLSTRAGLEQWCDEEEAYIVRMEDES